MTSDPVMLAWLKSKGNAEAAAKLARMLADLKAAKG